MAELADAADSKSAGTWYLGGSTPPPGTMHVLNQAKRLTEVKALAGQAKANLHPLAFYRIYVASPASLEDRAGDMAALQN